MVTTLTMLFTHFSFPPHSTPVVYPVDYRGFSVWSRPTLARDSICAIARYMLSPVRPSVCLSVCHTGGSVKDGWS